MRLKTKVMLAVVPAASLVAAGGIIAATVALRRRRRKRASSFMPEEVRATLEQLCSLKGADFIPDGLGTSLYQRRLSSLTDRQLVGVYVMVKLVEALRNCGLDLHGLSKKELADNVGLVRGVFHERDGRKEVLHQLGSLGAEAARSILSDALLVAGMMA